MSRNGYATTCAPPPLAAATAGGGDACSYPSPCLAPPFASLALSQALARMLTGPARKRAGAELPNSEGSGGPAAPCLRRADMPAARTQTGMLSAAQAGSPLARRLRTVAHAPALLSPSPRCTSLNPPGPAQPHQIPSVAHPALHEHRSGSCCCSWLGVDKIFLREQADAVPDAVAERLQPLIDDGTVNLGTVGLATIPNSEFLQLQRDWFNRCAKPDLAGLHAWIAFLDLDEFLVVLDQCALAPSALPHELSAPSPFALEPPADATKHARQCLFQRVLAASL